MGLPFIKRVGRYSGVSIADIKDVEKRVKQSRYDYLVLFGALYLPVIPSIAINLFCGLIRYPVKVYLIITFFGALVQATILGIVGWQVGNIYINLVDDISYLNDIITVIIILAIVIYIIKKKRDKR